MNCIILYLDLGWLFRNFPRQLHFIYERSTIPEFTVILRYEKGSTRLSLFLRASYSSGDCYAKISGGGTFKLKVTSLLFLFFFSSMSGPLWLYISWLFFSFSLRTFSVFLHAALVCLISFLFLSFFYFFFMAPYLCGRSINHTLASHNSFHSYIQN